MRVALLSRAAHPLHDPGGLERAVFHLALTIQASIASALPLRWFPTRSIGLKA